MISTSRPGDMRRHRRRAIPVDTLVTDMIGQRLMGYAIDLSIGGMRLLVAERLPKRSLHQVRFDLDGRAATVHVEAGIEIIRCQAVERGWLVGARFIHLGEWRAGLEEWLASVGRGSTADSSPALSTSSTAAAG